MKRDDKRLLNTCIDLYWDYLEMLDKQSDIAKEGATQEGKLVEFQGDFPQASNVKPDVTSNKVDKMRRYTPLAEHQIARDCMVRVLRVHSLKMREDLCGSIVLYRRIQKATNPDTRQLYTHKDCARILGLSFEKYRILRDKGQAALLEAYKRKIQDVAV